MLVSTRNWPRLLELGITPQNIGEPFAGYKDHDDCVAKNPDKEDPDAWCATVRRDTELCGICGKPKLPDWKTHFKQNHGGLNWPEAKAINPSENENTPALSSSQERKSAIDRLKQLGLVAFEMHSKLAVPTVSGNKRRWTKDNLTANIPHWIGKPVMLDHSQGVGDVVARTMDAFWGPSRARPEDTVEALRAYSFGIMDDTLFEKLRTDGKNVIGVPLVKGLSIGGSADVEYDEEGNEIPKNFIPEEYSITPFPGIKEAEIEKMVPIMESLRRTRVDTLRQRLTESQMPEFIPIFLIPLRGEACPEGYEKDSVSNTCTIPQQMAKLPPEVQEYLKTGAAGHVLVTDLEDKPVIYVAKSWVDQAIKAVGETGKPAKEWMERCIDAVTKSDSTTNPAAVSGNVWFHVLGEWARRHTTESLKNRVELAIPAKTQEQINKLYEKFTPDKVEVKIPDNLFTQTMHQTMSFEEQKKFDAAILNMEREKRGLPPIGEAEHGMLPPEADGSCPEGYEKGDDGMCHLKMSKVANPEKEAATRQKIIEQLEKEVADHKESLQRVDILRKEADDLKRKLREQATMFKALEEGRRLPITTGKGKNFTQTPDGPETTEIVSLEDSQTLYRHFIEQGYSRNDAAEAVIVTMLKQAGFH